MLGIIILKIKVFLLRLYNKLFQYFINVKLFSNFTTNKIELDSFFSNFRDHFKWVELIKIGQGNDGTYFLPDDLNGIAYCFSPGVSDVCDFELTLANNYGIKSFMIDYTVDHPPVNHELFDFEKLFLSDTNEENKISLDKWIENKIPNYDEDLLLQMDIEGSEFDIFNNIPDEYLQKFRIIVVEFHFLNNLILKNKFEKINNSFQKLFKFFYIVHAHPNNAGMLTEFHDMIIPNTLEITFIRKDRLKKLKTRDKLMNINDIKNSLFYNEIKLPELWWK